MNSFALFTFDGLPEFLLQVIRVFFLHHVSFKKWFIFFSSSVQWIWSSFARKWSVDEKLSATFNVDLSHFQSNYILRILTTIPKSEEKNEETHEDTNYKRGNAMQCVEELSKKKIIITMTHGISMHVKMWQEGEQRVGKRKNERKKDARKSEGEKVNERDDIVESSWSISMIHSFWSDTDKGDS